MKSKTLGTVLALVLLSACLSNPSITEQGPTDGLDISTQAMNVSSEIPAMSATPPRASPSEPTKVANVNPTDFVAVESATPVPYWGISPLQVMPDGGWNTYANAQYGFSFEYPASYDTGSCGKVKVIESAQEFALQFEGGTTSIAITPTDEFDLESHVQRLVSENGYSPKSTVDDFRMDGVPAVRIILPIGMPPTSQYQKLALLIHQDKLYLFKYSFVNFFWCDPPPISEEAMYEHLISTWHFLP